MSAALEMDEVRQCVSALSLAHLNTAFILFDDVTKLDLVRAGPSQTLPDSFRSNFGHHWNEKSLLEIKGSNETLKLTGLIASEGASNQRTQLIFVNGRLVRKTSLHSTVRNILQKSVMCRAPDITL